MRGNATNMLVTIILVSAICGLVQSSGVSLAAPPGPSPVVTAASSQYFERTFNRLVAAPPHLEPVFPVAPPLPVIPAARAPSIVPIGQASAFIPVVPAPPVLQLSPSPPPVHIAPQIPVANIPNVFRVAPVPRAIPLLPARPVFVQPRDEQKPTASANPSPNQPEDPNVAIAVATANAAAPVATILLPPYPFGPPPSFGFIPSSPTFVPDEKREKESTTESSSPKEATTTEKDSTTPVSSNIDNSFVQPLPSNDNVNFRQYLPPPYQLPLAPYPTPVSRPQTVKPQVVRPQRVKTSVEVVPVPLTYIAPPPLKNHHPVKLIKVTKHIHTYIPTGRIIIRPVSHRIRSVGNSVYAMAYRRPISTKNVARYSKTVNRRSKSRDIEPTTLRPFTRPNIRLPRL